MLKEQLLVKQQHEVVNGEITKRFTIYVTKGTEFRQAEFQGVKQVVEIKAFRISVQEVWLWESQPYRDMYHDFGFITSRAGEFASALRQMKSCDSIDGMRKIIASVEKDFSAALDRDATRELKRILGIGRKKSPLHTRTNRNTQPLPQIKLPWLEE